MPVAKKYSWKGFLSEKMFRTISLAIIWLVYTVGGLILVLLFTEDKGCNVELRLTIEMKFLNVQC